MDLPTNALEELAEELGRFAAVASEVGAALIRRREDSGRRIARVKNAVTRIKHALTIIGLELAGRRLAAGIADLAVARDLLAALLPTHPANAPVFDRGRLPAMIRLHLTSAADADARRGLVAYVAGLIESALDGLPVGLETEASRLRGVLARTVATVRGDRR